VVKNQSIKNNKLCETKPISQKPKMNLTHYLTSDYDNNSDIPTLEKQTQTKPILDLILLKWVIKTEQS
jgi:hypothetical protein